MFEYTEAILLGRKDVSQKILSNSASKRIHMQWISPKYIGSGSKALFVA